MLELHTARRSTNTRTRPLMCMLLGFESMHLPPNVALFALEDNQSSAKALEPRDCRTIAANVLRLEFANVNVDS